MLQPERVIFAFEKASDLGNQAHAEAYREAFVGVVRSIEGMLRASVSIALPGESWMPSFDDQDLEAMAHALYWDEQDEQQICIKAGDVQFTLTCVPDPIWFALDC